MGPNRFSSFRPTLPPLAMFFLISHPFLTFVAFFAPFPTLLKCLHSLLILKRYKKTESTENNKILTLSVLHMGQCIAFKKMECFQN